MPRSAVACARAPVLDFSDPRFSCCREVVLHRFRIAGRPASGLCDGTPGRSLHDGPCDLGCVRAPQSRDIRRDVSVLVSAGLTAGTCTVASQSPLEFRPLLPGNVCGSEATERCLTE